MYAQERLQAAIQAALGGEALTPLDMLVDEAADEATDSDMESVGEQQHAAASDEPSDPMHVG